MNDILKKYTVKKSVVQQGFIIPALLALIITFGTLMIVVSGVISNTLGSAARNQSSQVAINIAEAGINYYLWHMSHNSGDYKDGTTAAQTPDSVLGYGPYVHDYKDSTGAKRGTFTLYIKPGENGSNVTTVRSEAKQVGAASIERVVVAELGAPSFSAYAVASNSELWFGSTETADGPVHSNVGVKMDGPNNSVVTSANQTYVPSSSSGPGSGSSRPGVWCDSSITSPNCNTRSKDSWRYPIASIDFNKISGDLCSLKKSALNDQSSNACNKKPSRTSGYVPPANTQFSDDKGYLITLKTNGKYKLEEVRSENDMQVDYDSALNTRSTIDNITIPSDGIVFVEDNVWVRTEAGGFDGRITIASARLAVSGDTVATIVDNVKYKDKFTGNDAIGIISEDNLDIAPYIPVPLEINAALISQRGRVQFRPNYNYNSYYDTPGYIQSNETLNFFGSIASNEQWTWSWVRCSYNSTSCWSGFKNNTTSYDENLRYAPPPNFPVTNTFDILKWREVIKAP